MLAMLLVSALMVVDDSADEVMEGDDPSSGSDDLTTSIFSSSLPSVAGLSTDDGSTIP